MYPHEKFRYAGVNELIQDIARMQLDIPVKVEPSDIWRQPVTIGTKQVPNRLAIHPMEGCDGTVEGKPAELTYRRYERFARGGAGLLWFEATAVVAEGRANPRQLLLVPENKAAIADLLHTALQAARQEHGEHFRPYSVIQLTHSGRYSKPQGVPAPIIAANNPYLDKYLPEQYHIISDDELATLEDKYVKAAEIAADIGFDAVDIKCCHRYLASELLAAHTRAGRYGGSFENRIRFVCNIVDKIRAKLGNRIDIAVRLNVYDAIPYPYGWGVDKHDVHKADWSEPVEFARILRDKGVKLINVTAGNPYYNPHVNRPYDLGYYTPPFHPLENVAILLNSVRAIQQAVPDVTVVGTGFSWLRQLGANVAAACLEQGWFAIAGFGRQAFAYPDFAKDLVAAGELNPQKVCVACSNCAVIMRDGGKTGCIVRDGTIYAPLYKAGREGKPPINSSIIAEHV